MATIEVTELNQNLFDVTVIGPSTTQHRITVASDYAATLTKGNMTTTELIEASFHFLLARESNTSILRNFDLTVISQYFPEFERSIQAQG